MGVSSDLPQFTPALTGDVIFDIDIQFDQRPADMVKSQNSSLMRNPMGSQMRSILLAFLLLASSTIVSAQAIDTTVCLVVTSEKDVAYATGGKPLTSCDPQRIYQMISGDNASIMLLQYTADGRLITTMIYGSKTRLRGEKIRVSTMRYTQSGNLIYDRTPDGCVITRRIFENNAKYLSMQDVSAGSSCESVVHTAVEIGRSQPPSRMLKIKL